MLSKLLRLDKNKRFSCEDMLVSEGYWQSEPAIANYDRVLKYNLQQSRKEEEN